MFREKKVQYAYDRKEHLDLVSRERYRVDKATYQKLLHPVIVDCKDINLQCLGGELTLQRHKID